MYYDYAGSPPRMRGKPYDTAPGEGSVGITPADAGKTKSPKIPIPETADHPRGCGENQLRLQLRQSMRGSPPRMRGKPQNFRSRKSPKRITPADAGKTLRRQGRNTHRWDHPRGCGENFRRLLEPVNRPGSPPRMRGKPNLSTRYLVNARITPADAGKTCE